MKPTKDNNSKTAAEIVETLPAVPNADVQELLDLEAANDDELNEEEMFDEREFYKIEENRTYVGRVVGIKYLPNNFYKPSEPETKRNCKEKAHVEIDLLNGDNETTPVLINAVSVVNFCQRIFAENQEIKNFAMKFETQPKETNANGTFIPCKFFTKKF